LLEIALFNDLCEAIVPGARAASVGHYLDYQLSLAPNDCLLFARYLPIPLPFLHFYRLGAKGIESAAARAGDTSKSGPSQANWRQIAKGMYRESIVGWDGPSSPLLYLSLRNDALDVVYGTDKGLQKLGIPIMRHSRAAPPLDEPSPTRNEDPIRNQGTDRNAK
jgi:hypothetical protein